MDISNEPLTGPAMAEMLQQHGIKPYRCILKRSGEHRGCYVADFAEAGDQWVGKRPEDAWSAKAIDSAKSWAARIKAALPGAKIVFTHENRADWRPGCPVIAAMIVFRWHPAAAAADKRRKRSRSTASAKAVA